MTNERVDQILRQALSPEVPDEKVNRKLKREMRASIEAGREGIMKRFNMKKAVILAAACCLLIGTAAVASSGKISALVSGFYYKEFKNFQQITEVQANVGFHIKAVERFQNGYEFSRMYVHDTKGLDDDGNAVEQYKEVTIDYKKAGGDDLSLNAIQEIYAHEEDRRDADQTASVAGVTVKYYVDTYKWVPEDYELTAKDEENMMRDNYNISVGADEVSENKVTYAVWFQDGIRYSILNVHGATPSDVLFQMAEEIITNQ